MGKKSRRLPTSTAVLAAEEVPVVGQREACPCGSGKRYKACHGRLARTEAVRYVERPFAGLPGECDWVALREIVPAATAVIGVQERFGGGEVTVASILPMAWSALHRADGTVFVGLQTPGGSGDAARDVAAALITARDAEPGSPIADAGLPGPGPRLQDVLVLDDGFDVTVHEGFDYWFDGVDELAPDVLESLRQANESAVPTRRLTSVAAAYWCQAGARRHLRWVLPHPEGQVLDGLARLHAAGGSGLVEGSRYVGSFRADGLIVPVWDLPDDAEADELEQPVADFESRLLEAMAAPGDLTPEQRRARAGVVSRQLTLR
jgi:hypothetical protein